MSFTVTILGTNAAYPTQDSITSAQILNINEHLYLIDCGEGTQMKMQQYGVRRNRINAIFISHLHGDHLYGLPGVLTSFGHFQRSKPLSIFGPKGIKEYVEVTLRLSQAYIGFEIHIIEINDASLQKIYEDAYIDVYAFPLTHRIPTFGYRFTEKIGLSKIRPEKIEEYQLSYEDIKCIKKGQDLQLTNKNIIKNEELTYPKPKGRSFAYCSDTMYDENIIPYISNVDILYHEATYLEDMEEQAGERMHSTSTQAAKIAQKGDVGQLILGHFSTRYKPLDLFLTQSKSVFSDSHLGIEGHIFEIKTKNIT